MVDILYDIGEWVIRLVMVPIVARQHRPMTAVAWLGFIFFIPWVGLGIYLLFGAYNLQRDVSRHALLFIEDWYFATHTLPEGAHLFPPAEATGEMLIQTVPDGPTYPTDAIQHMLVEAIYMAKHRLILTSPYFVPDEPLRLALRLAALRGADVHIIIPKRSDRLSADLAARAFFQDLLDVGIHIHLHQRGVLHAKSMSVDDAIAMVGTANFDLRSLYLNYELALFFYSNDIASTLQRLQMRYIEESLAVDRTTWDQRPLFRQLTEHTLKLLSPLL